MENGVKFNLDKSVEFWIDKVQSDSAFTESDAEELKCHLFDLIDELKINGLSEEEAFIIASKRLGDSLDLRDEYNETNRPVIQMHRSLLILSGVFVYFLCYYFILCTSKLLFIVLEFLSINVDIALEWVSRYLISWHFLFVLFFVSIYLLEKKTILFIERIRLKPKYTILLVVITFFFVLTDFLMTPLIMNLIGNIGYLLNLLYNIYRYFKFSFPLLIIIGFILIYFRYYKKSKI